MFSKGATKPKADANLFEALGGDDALRLVLKESMRRITLDKSLTNFYRGVSRKFLEEHQFHFMKKQLLVAQMLGYELDEETFKEQAAYLSKAHRILFEHGANEEQFDIFVGHFQDALAHEVELKACVREQISTLIFEPFRIVFEEQARKVRGKEALLLARLGGEKTLRTAVHEMSSRVMHCEILGSVFRGFYLSLEQLQEHQHRFFLLAFTGTQGDNTRDMMKHLEQKHAAVKEKFGLTGKHFDLMVLHFTAVLEQLNIHKDDIREVVHTIEPFRSAFCKDTLAFAWGKSARLINSGTESGEANESKKCVPDQLSEGSGHSNTNPPKRCSDGSSRRRKHRLGGRSPGRHRSKREEVQWKREPTEKRQAGVSRRNKTTKARSSRTEASTSPRRKPQRVSKGNRSKSMPIDNAELEDNEMGDMEEMRSSMVESLRKHIHYVDQGHNSGNESDANKADALAFALTTTGGSSGREIVDNESKGDASNQADALAFSLASAGRNSGSTCADKQSTGGNGSKAGTFALASSSTGPYSCNEKQSKGGIGNKADALAFALTSSGRHSGSETGDDKRSKGDKLAFALTSMRLQDDSNKDCAKEDRYTSALTSLSCLDGSHDSRKTAMEDKSDRYASLSTMFPGTSSTITDHMRRNEGPIGLAEDSEEKISFRPCDEEDCTSADGVKLKEGLMERHAAAAAMLQKQPSLLCSGSNKSAMDDRSDRYTGLSSILPGLVRMDSESLAASSSTAASSCHMRRNEGLIGLEEEE